MTIFYQTRCCWLQQSSGSPPSGHGWTYPKRLSESSDKAENSVPIQSTACYSLNVLENLRTRLETIIFTTKKFNDNFLVFRDRKLKCFSFEQSSSPPLLGTEIRRIFTSKPDFFPGYDSIQSKPHFFFRTWTFWDALAKGKNSPIFLTRLTFH